MEELDQLPIQAISGNNYMEFTVTPNSGYQCSASCYSNERYKFMIWSQSAIALRTFMTIRWNLQQTETLNIL